MKRLSNHDLRPMYDVPATLMSQWRVVGGFDWLKIVSREAVQ